VDEINTQNNTVADLGSHEYKLAFEQIVIPLAKEFQPDIILISCGFDGAIGDPIGCSKLSPMMYCWMSHQLARICERILVVQEGGYNTDLMKYHAYGVVKGLLTKKGDDLQAAFGPATPAGDFAGISMICEIDACLANVQAKKNI
jgi:histone deacetylase 6